MSVELPIRSATVPSPLDCIVSNENWQALVNLLTVDSETVVDWNIGATTPPPSRRGDPWLRYNSDGTPDKVYVYAMGAWLSKHPDAAGKVIMFEGAEGDIDTFDGGEAGAVTDISGPMWEKVTSMNARLPIGPGTLPSTTVIGVGDQGGEEEHELDEAEMPPHRHFVVSAVDQDPGPAAGGLDVASNNFIAKSSNYDGAGSPFSYHLGGAVPEPTIGLSQSRGGSGSPKAVEGHNTLPPYTGIFFIRKTARTMYRL